jgi:hypothetical protein
MRQGPEKTDVAKMHNIIGALLNKALEMKTPWFFYQWQLCNRVAKTQRLQRRRESA